MMMKYLHLFFLLATTQIVIAQNDDLVRQVAPVQIAGKWKGSIYQDAGGLAKEYVFELDIQYKDNKITGSSYIYDAPTRSFATISLSGTLSGTQVQLQEHKISKSEIIPMAYWCIKKMDLKMNFSNGQFTLSGNWSGKSEMGDCSPGTVTLSKHTIRAR